MVEKPLRTVPAPYWLGFTRKNVARGWRNHNNDKVKLDLDPTQFKKPQSIIDSNRAVMGTVGHFLN